MPNTYFDIKRKLKKLYDSSLSAAKKLNIRHTNFLLLELDALKDDLVNADVDSFGKYVLDKDIEQIKYIINTNIKKKQVMAGAKTNEKGRPKNL